MEMGDESAFGVVQALVRKLFCLPYLCFKISTIGIQSFPCIILKNLFQDYVKIN